MSDAATFYQLYTGTIRQLIDDIERARTLIDRMDSDTGLVAAASAAAAADGRSDLTQAAFTASRAALFQILFTFDSGAPSQKSALFHML